MRRFCVIVVLSMLAACAVPHIPAYVVYEEPGLFVRLEFAKSAQYERPETWNDHPAVVSIDQMKRVLHGLRVREHRASSVAPVLNWLLDEPQVLPAFGEKEITVLAPELVNALAVAVPEEMVTFYVSTPLNSSTREVSSGGMYVANGNLHVILSNHKSVYGVPAFGLIYDRRHPTYSLVPRGFDLDFVDPDVVVKIQTTFFDRLIGHVSDEEIILNLDGIPPA